MTAPLLYGDDISTYQSQSLAFAQQLKDMGRRFVWMRITMGAHGIDGGHYGHHDYFGQVGIDRGPYHFLQFSSTAADNAANFIRQIRNFPQWELNPMVDVEQGGFDPRTNANIILETLQRVEQAIQRTPWLYTYKSWWDNNVDPDPAFTHYLNWVARYLYVHNAGGELAPGEWVAPAAPWPFASMYQFSNTNGTLDLDAIPQDVYDKLKGVPVVNPPKVPWTYQPFPGNMSLGLKNGGVRALKLILAYIGYGGFLTQNDQFDKATKDTVAAIQQLHEQKMTNPHDKWFFPGSPRGTGPSGACGIATWNWINQMALAHSMGMI